MAEVEGEDGLPEVPPKRTKRGLYKLYKYDKTKKIPRQTIHGWKKKQGEEESNPENRQIDEKGDASILGDSFTPQNSSQQEIDHSGLHDIHETEIQGCSSRAPKTDNEDIIADQHSPSFDWVNDDSDELYVSSSEDDFFWSSSDDDDDILHNGAQDGTLYSLLFSDDDYDVGDEKQLEGDPSTSREDDLLYAFPIAGGTYNSTLTRTEACAAILAYSLKHCSTYSAMQDLLELIDIVLPSPNRLPKSVFATKQSLTPHDLTKSAVYHRFCHGCFQILGDIELTCRCCGRGQAATTGNNFFISIDVREQIKAILERKNVWNNIQKQYQRRGTGSITDVINGKKYLCQCADGGFLADPNNLSLIFNTDGVPLFKSSKQKIWPVYLAINELPPKQRFSKKNLILWGVWQGCQMPVMNTFLSPFIETLRSLRDEGLQFKNPTNDEIITSHFKLLLGTFDLQARAIVCNIHHHNGSYGCLYCEEKGLVVPSGKGYCRCYPFSEEVVHRNKAMLEENALDAQALGSKVIEPSTVMGIKGVNVFMALEDFDLTIGIVVDYMHCILLGVTKTMMELWFLPKNNKKDCFIGLQVEDIDRRLLTMVPPDFIKRPPRSIQQLKYWKASEFRNWLLFYGIPCMQGILQDHFLYHFALLVEGIYIILGDEITEDLLKRAKCLLLEFYKLYLDYYGSASCGLNVHNIRHLVECVENWGPLWAWSCFGFEGMNGEMMKFVHGTKNICLQILWMVSAQKNLSLRGSALASGSKFQKFFVRMMATSNRFPKQLLQANDCSVAGKLQPLSPKDLPATLMRKIEAIIGDDGTHYSFSKAYRVVRQSEFYYSMEYTKCRKRNGYTVSYQKLNGHKDCFGHIQFFLLVQPSMCVLAIIQPLVIDLVCEKFCHLIPVKAVERITQNMDVLPFNCIGRKSFFLAGNKDCTYVAKIPNANEKD